MKRPDQAFILAAGFGTRLLPLTRLVPKPLLPLGGVPMLERALALVRGWGVREVVVNVHHGAEAVVRHLVRRVPDGLKIAISFEPEILGTGGALSRAAWFFRTGRPFWMVNADVAAEVDGDRIARAFRPGKTMAAAWLMATRGPRTVACADGVITDFATKHPRTPGTYTFCGVHLVDPAVLRYLPATGFASIIEAYQKAMADGWTVAGVSLDRGYWADIGTPAQYVAAAAELGGAGRGAGEVEVRSGMILGPGVPRRRYAGIMALPAAEALDAAERAVAARWRFFRGDTVACPLAPRGSARAFTRLVSGDCTAMLVRHDPAREENNRYAGHTRFLRGLGLPVPRVLAEDAGRSITLFSDAGERSVQDESDAWRRAHLERLYRRVLARMVVFHEEGARAARRVKLPLMPPFDAALYAWEHDLFAVRFLREQAGVDAATERAVRAELSGVAARLLGLPRVLVHRDFQSSNLLVAGGRWTLIDYQGMRLGPAVYDLASLLCDPYIAVDAAVRERLLAGYARRADRRARVAAMFWPAAVQRLGQALGAYARLAALPGTGHFALHIPVAVARLAEAAERAGGLPVLESVLKSVAGETPENTRA